MTSLSLVFSSSYLTLSILISLMAIFLTVGSSSLSRNFLMATTLKRWTDLANLANSEGSTAGDDARNMTVPGPQKLLDWDKTNILVMTEKWHIVKREGVLK